MCVCGGVVVVLVVSGLLPKATDNTNDHSVSPAAKEENTHETRGWLCSKYQVPSSKVLMNLHQPLGFAPAGDPVNFLSTCSST